MKGAPAIGETDESDRQSPIRSAQTSEVLLSKSSGNPLVKRFERFVMTRPWLCHIRQRFDDPRARVKFVEARKSGKGV